MVYLARVIDNTDFAEKGTIKVRVDEFCHYSKSMCGDLSEVPSRVTANGTMWKVDDSEKYIKDSDDLDAFVMSAFGGGREYGVFRLPQVNSIGVVTELGSDRTGDAYYAWLGNIIDNTNYPTDPSVDSDINAASNSAGKNDIINRSANDTLVIKMKHTFLGDSLAPSVYKDRMDWNKRPVDIMVTIGNNGINMEQNSYLYDEDTYELGGTDENKIKKASTLKIDGDGFSLAQRTYDKDGNNTGGCLLSMDSDNNFSLVNSDSDGKKSTSISSADNSVKIDVVSGNKMSSVTQESEKITSVVGNSNIVVSNDSVEINSSKEVNINVAEGGKVNLGSSGMPVLLSPNSSGVTLGSTTLNASKTLFG